MSGWPPGEAEKYTPILTDCFDQGGWFRGMFEDKKLIGVAVLDNKFIGKEDALKLLMSAKATQNLELPEQQYWLDQEMGWVKDEKVFRKITDPVAFERCEHLVESHTRFRKLVNGSRYKVVEPVLPMDVLGVYIILPQA